MLSPTRARASDAAAIRELREAAARWLVSLGLRQWEPGEVTRAEVTLQVRKGQWFVVRGGSGGLRAALRLVDEDRDTWGMSSDRALYVHGLVVAREEVGAGLGADLLRWVETVAARKELRLVRLDAVEGNERLLAYYRQLGFHEVGRATFDDPRWYPTVLLEKRLNGPSSSDDRRDAIDAFSVVRAGYDAIGTRYRDSSSANPVRLRWVARLEAELAAGGVVVDLGCGAGEPATRLLAQAHAVIGVDASATQLKLAKGAAPGALLVQADMTRLALRHGSVDAVTSFYAFGHVPAAQHAPLLMNIASWLKPDGLLLASTPVRPGDVDDPDWLGVRMFFGGIGEEAMRRATTEAALDALQWEVVPEDEGDGQTGSSYFRWGLDRPPPMSSMRSR